VPVIHSVAAIASDRAEIADLFIEPPILLGLV
jgi:hypothetical protein